MSLDLIKCERLWQNNSCRIPVAALVRTTGDVRRERPVFLLRKFGFAGLLEDLFPSGVGTFDGSSRGGSIGHVRAKLCR